MTTSRYFASLFLLVLSCSSCASKLDQPHYSGHFKIFDKKALELFDTTENLELLADGFRWSEGPLWVSELNCLLFSDIPNNKVHKYCPGSGLSTYIPDSGKANGLALNSEGELILMRGGLRNVSRMDADIAEPKPKYSILAESIEGKKLSSPNDLVIASNGAIFFTDPPYELKGGINSPDKELSYQGLFYLNTNKHLLAFDKDISWPNGLALSSDERFLFLAVSDPDMPVWYRYELGEKEGSYVKKELFFDSRDELEPKFQKGLPDGMKLHSSGVILATGPGGVWLFSEQGSLLARLLVEDRPVANLALDENEEYLYLTASDQLLRIKLK